MAINRAAILQQLQLKLQQSLGNNAEVSLLQLPASPTTKPQVLLRLVNEKIIEQQQGKESPLRQLHFTVDTIADAVTLATDKLNLLQVLDSLAEQIELALLSSEQANLWTDIKAQNSEFNLSATAPNPNLIQHFVLTWQVLREEVCPPMNIQQVYLSNQGDPHELVTTLPAD